MSTLGHIIGPGGYLKDDEWIYVVAIIDLDKSPATPQLLPIGFLGHDVVFDPQKPHCAAIFEKRGPGACYVDLNERVVLSTIKTTSNQHFYGHGVYSSDASLLYATESVIDDDFRGLLVVRDAKSFDVIGELPTFGTAPHDCWLIDDGKTMVVANGGGTINSGSAPNVSYIDVASESLLERVDIDNPRFNTGHLAIDDRGNLAVVSAPREGLPNPHAQLGAVTLMPKGKAAKTMVKPNDVTNNMLGESLSVAIAEGQAVTTHPDGNMVSIWDIEAQAFLRRIDVQEPRGVSLTLDKRFFVLSHRIEKSVVLTLLPVATNEALQTAIVDPSYTSGSHIFTYALPPSAA